MVLLDSPPCLQCLLGNVEDNCHLKQSEVPSNYDTNDAIDKYNEGAAYIYGVDDTPIELKWAAKPQPSKPREEQKCLH